MFCPYLHHVILAYFFCGSLSTVQVWLVQEFTVAIMLTIDGELILCGSKGYYFTTWSSTEVKD